MSKKLVVFASLLIMFPAVALAQLHWGGGVEFSEDGPDTGINLRIEYPFTLKKYENFIFHAGFTGNFFPTDRLETRFDGLPEELDLLGQSYQFGGNITAEYKTPVVPIHPYGIFNVGFESINVKFNERNRSPLEDPHPLASVSSTHSFPYFEIGTGVKITRFPVLKPFAEFRFHESLGEIGDLEGNAPSDFNVEGSTRFIFGFMIELR